MGKDGFILPLWRKTALRLLLKECRKRRHSLAMWSSPSFSNKAGNVITVAQWSIYSEYCRQISIALSVMSNQHILLK